MTDQDPPKPVLPLSKKLCFPFTSWKLSKNGQKGNNFPYQITNPVDNAAHLLAKDNGKQRSDVAIQDKIANNFVSTV